MKYFDFLVQVILKNIFQKLKNQKFFWINYFKKYFYLDFVKNIYYKFHLYNIR